MRVDYNYNKKRVRNSNSVNQQLQERRLRRKEENEDQELRQEFSKRDYALAVYEASEWIVGNHLIKHCFQVEKKMEVKLEKLSEEEKEGEYLLLLLNSLNDMERSSPLEEKTVIQAKSYVVKKAIEERALFEIPAVLFGIPSPQRLLDLAEKLEKTENQRERKKILLQMIRSPQKFEIELEFGRKTKIKECLCFACGQPWGSHFLGEVEIGRNGEGEIQFLWPRTGRRIVCPSTRRETFPVSVPSPKEDPWAPQSLLSLLSRAAAFLPFSSLLEILERVSLGPYF